MTPETRSILQSAWVAELRTQAKTPLPLLRGMRRPSRASCATPCRPPASSSLLARERRRNRPARAAAAAPALARPVRERAHAADRPDVIDDARSCSG
jgi:hypothetical protein